MSTIMVGSDKVYVRHLIPKSDIPRAVLFPSYSSEHPSSEEELRSITPNSCCFMRVADFGQKAVGFVVWEQYRSGVRIRDVAVDPAWKQRRLDWKLIMWVVENILGRRWKEVWLHVRETDLPLQLFLRERCFWARGVIPHHYPDTEEAAYWMQFHRSVPRWVRPRPSHQWYNRVSFYFGEEVEAV